MIVRRIVAALVFFIASCAGGIAQAQSCHAEATPLVFGRYDPLSSQPTDATATIAVRCDASSGVDGLPMSVGVDLATAAAPTLRAASGEGLRYVLSPDPGYRLAWRRHGVAGAHALAASGNGRVEARIPVYGRLPAKQWVQPGTYTDTIVVTVEF